MLFLRTFTKSLSHALRGLATLFRSQRNARIHLVIAIAVIGAGFLFKIYPGEWLAVVLCIALVLSMEAINTALELLADALHPDHHPLVGKAKDVAAGAVLLCALASVAVGAIIFLPKAF